MAPEHFLERTKLSFYLGFEISTLTNSPKVRQEADVHAWCMCRPKRARHILSRMASDCLSPGGKERRNPQNPTAHMLDDMRVFCSSLRDGGKAKKWLILLLNI